MKTVFLALISSVFVLTGCVTAPQTSQNQDPIGALITYKEARGVTPDEVGMAAINAGGTGEVVSGTPSDVTKDMVSISHAVYCCNVSGQAISLSE